MNRDIDWNYTVSREMTREIGDIYLLVFAAVALRQFEQYNHRTVGIGRRIYLHGRRRQQADAA